MNAPSYGDADPIAALATPLAESALALIRTAGGRQPPNGTALGEHSQSAIGLLARVFSSPEKLIAAPPNSIVYGWIVEPQDALETKTSGGERKKIDEVLVSVYRSPRSYTGEDGADISCHGGIATIKAVMSALKKAGFREALPGEFTFRAFMNGKLDFTRAESVMELVSAKTHKGREQALRRLAGVLQAEICAIKDLLVEVLAGTEIYLDYSEDEFFPAGSGGSQPGASDEEIGRLPDRILAEEAASRLKMIASLWDRERIYAEGSLAVIAGRPNAGKSSLFNYLIREDRSIVTDVPGTTRDWIEALISVEGIPLRLADTAGLRDAGQESEAERIGITRSLDLLDRADLVLYIIDGADGITAEDREFLASRKDAISNNPLLVIWNKADIAPDPLREGELPVKILPVSAKTGDGIPELLRSITGLLETKNVETCSQNAAGPGTVRQKDLIDTALAAVEEALALTGDHAPLDIIAPLFRSAIHALGEITGEVSGEDIFEAMFSRFCVGK
ncbi:MAG: tRNA uridine-5-carboxymethylaminomethyl(34) synthesis GTPase MnmE [Treponema sp.]|nr:tRNA uridine-5-carboxymethylaminomethyl(34) synthesis GTPase MnmE [Treponema sp.]